MVARGEARQERPCFWPRQDRRGCASRSRLVECCYCSAPGLPAHMHSLQGAHRRDAHLRDGVNDGTEAARHQEHLLALGPQQLHQLRDARADLQGNGGTALSRRSVKRTLTASADAWLPRALVPSSRQVAGEALAPRRDALRSSPWAGAAQESDAGLPATAASPRDATPAPVQKARCRPWPCGARVGNAHASAYRGEGKPESAAAQAVAHLAVKAATCSPTPRNAAISSIDSSEQLQRAGRIPACSGF